MVEKILFAKAPGYGKPGQLRERLEGQGKERRGREMKRLQPHHPLTRFMVERQCLP
jgi:hypothetical protein